MRAFRAWGLSVLCCTGMMVVAVNLMDAVAGRWPPSWHDVLDVTAAVTVVFAAVAALGFIPAFLLLGRVPRLARDRRLMALAGALLAPAVVIAFRVTFAESGDPTTTWGWVGHFARNPGELGSSVALAIPALTFGLAWAGTPGRTR